MNRSKLLIAAKRGIVAFILAVLAAYGYMQIPQPVVESVVDKIIPTQSE